MKTDPHELRLHRTPRGEAVRRAARLVKTSQAKSAGPAPATLDEAFAELADSAPVENQGAQATSDLVGQISTQLKQLDAQRERLSRLLSDLDAS